MPLAPGLPASVKVNPWIDVTTTDVTLLDQRGTLGRRAARLTGGIPMADKSPKKTTTKTAASKSLKEKRADKKDKAASKRKD